VISVNRINHRAFSADFVAAAADNRCRKTHWTSQAVISSAGRNPFNDAWRWRCRREFFFGRNEKKVSRKFAMSTGLNTTSVTQEDHMGDADPRSIIRNTPMSTFQWVAVMICIGLNALDGFDILAITFAAPGISKAWALGPGALGVVISAGLFGMAAGSLFIAPVADRIGRRPVILMCLLAMTFGMLLSATARNVYVLAAWRIATGLGIGGMLASINAMVAEYANEQRRDLCVSLMAVGYPIGGVLGGSAAVWLLQRYDWQAVFVYGGAVSAVFLLAVWRYLPESIEFLAVKHGPHGLANINAILLRMGQRAATSVPALSTQPAHHVLDIFNSVLLPRTLIVCSAYFLFITTCYYALGWIPPLVVALGFSASDAASVSVWASLGGIIGGITLGYVARYLSLKYLGIAVMSATAVMLVMFGRTHGDLPVLKGVAFVLGLFLFASAVCLYAVLARVYPTQLRASGTGLAIGLGRIGGMLGPTLGGWLMEAGVSRPHIAAIMALGSACAAVVLMQLRTSLLAAPDR